MLAHRLIPRVEEMGSRSGNQALEFRDDSRSRAFQRICWEGVEKAGARPPSPFVILSWRPA